MLRSRIRYLLSGSLLLFLPGYMPVYSQMRAATGNISGLMKFKPAFTVALYKTEVDIVGNHLSGLLLIKKMQDSSTRMVFSNEMGFTFFDFEFTQQRNFKVFSFTKKMNKKALIKTLRNDFELILMEGLDSAS